MSRAKKKICRVRDLQGRYSDVILTKKDCDLISRALDMYGPLIREFNKKSCSEALSLSDYFRRLTRINKGRVSYINY